MSENRKLAAILAADVVGYRYKPRHVTLIEIFRPINLVFHSIPKPPQARQKAENSRTSLT